MSQYKSYLILPMVLIMFGLTGTGCGEERLQTTTDLLEFLDDPENGLVKERHTKEIRWGLKYLPSEYLTLNYLRSLDQYDQKIKDSVVDSYANTICFLLTVAPEQTGSEDVIYKGIRSSEEFQSRAISLNFAVKDLVTLNYGGLQAPAVVSTMENTYGLSNKRDIMIIFAKDHHAWQKADTFDCVFDDRIFNTGIHHFMFTSRDVKRLPVFEIPSHSHVES